MRRLLSVSGLWSPSLFLAVQYASERNGLGKHDADVSTALPPARESGSAEWMSRRWYTPTRGLSGLQKPPTAQGDTSQEEQEEEVKEALRSVFYDIRSKVRNKMRIGDLFRTLDKGNQRVLAKQRIPLEEFLLHFPHHFRTYRTKAATNTGTIQVCPPYQANPTVRQLQLAEAARRPVLVEIAAEEGFGIPGCSEATTFAANPGDPASLAAAVSPVLTKKQQLEIILSNLPDELTSFINVKLPQKIKEEYMGYPSVKPKEFFERYPQLFEVRDCPTGAHTFFVRRRTRYV